MMTKQWSIKYALLLLTVAFSCLLLRGQEKRDYIWMLGSSNNPAQEDTLWWTTVFNFNTSPLTVNRELAFMAVKYSAAMISDTAGNLLFYSNGCRVRNADFEVMPNGDSLIPGHPYQNYCFSSVGMAPREGMIILPDPADSQGYWLLNQATDTLHHPFIHLHKIFYYGYVDMSLDNGRGDVTHKGQRLGNDSLFSGMTAYRHANDRDWWIIIGKEFEHTFYKILLDDQGLHWLDTIILDTKLPNKKGSSGGQNIFSPDGTHYIQFPGPNDAVYVMDFDPLTGDISNPQRYDWPRQGLFGGCSVSPSGQFLYVNDGATLWQLDLWDQDPMSSLTVVGEWDQFFEPEGWPIGFGRQRLGPDCRIYVGSTDWSRYIHVILHPDRKGTDCDFRQRYIHTPAYTSYGIPNFPYYRVGTPWPLCDSTLAGPVSVEDHHPGYLQAGSLHLAPNPFTHTLQVSAGEHSPPPGTRLRVWHLTGRLLHDQAVTATHMVLDTTSWPSGWYAFTWQTPDGQLFTGRAVKTDAD